MVVGPVRPKPAHQASAEYKLRLFLGLSDLYYDAGYSAGSETERVALEKRPETQNRSTILPYSVAARAPRAAEHARTLTPTISLVVYILQVPL
jgi:hypothetical protein